ncbi:MAG TPA: GNAT family N-acetyltransferase [Streptosporangiaceae bacterium]|nr:GNAT family N-acetyltransferase [Streptosporangiaceae bacterium]
MADAARMPAVGAPLAAAQTPGGWNAVKVREVSGFRFAAPADAKSLVRLIRSAYRGESSRQGWTSEADLVGGDRISAEQVLAMIEGSNSIMLVFDEGDSIIACCHVEDRGGNVAYFGTFAVAPTEQGIGLGRRVLAEAERSAVTRFGSAVLELAVLAQQEKLIAWYERLGFSRSGETRPFPADPEFARALRNDLHFVVLSKNLAEPAAGVDNSSTSAQASS